MSETVKLIIEISEERYNSVMRKAKYTRVTGIDAVLTKGIPLDDVKAKISEIPKKYPMTVDYESGLNEALDIIDNIGKGDKE